MIVLESLIKEFGTLRAVDQLNLTVAQGEFFAVLGPNAAGKTTTIKMIAGLLKPTAGRALVCGIDVAERPVEAKALMSYIPDFPFLYEKMTPLEFMAFVADIHRLDGPGSRVRTAELFEKFHLGPFQSKLIDSLSHGTRQRLAVCAALLRDPKVLVVDEPMVGLDPTHSKIFKDEMRERSRAGATIFLSTHQLAVAEELADRIGIIAKGRLAAVGKVDEILSMTGQCDLESAFLHLVGEEQPEANYRT